eukprot:Blabericola_migrator_1__281@NODE_1072_length_5534_cov_146_501006_g735_i0_p1_GENE_NODE_1072_length_5534_cov_146_501006_g735_i0NODE_1072_length_5534_cov_146_501006_g735_i0_p1_ORF_typecomplete_len703_score81_36FH2/PF02181_23/6e33FH2/PF02181_23/18_NODE_1072_length_5534_cov_146_501006_g735_i033545462
MSSLVPPLNLSSDGAVHKVNPPRVRRPPPPLAKKPPPCKVSAKAPPPPQISTTKLHWVPIPETKVKGTVWEIISRTAVEEPSPSTCASPLSSSPDTPDLPLLGLYTKARSTIDYCSPRTTILGDVAEAPKAYPRFTLPHEMIKNHFFKSNPKSVPLSSPGRPGPPQATLKPPGKVAPKSVLSTARLQAVSICLKGLRLDGASKIAASLIDLFFVLYNVSFGNLTQESLLRRPANPSSDPCLVCQAQPLSQKEELYQISTQRNNRLLGKDELALIIDNWPTGEETRKLQQLKLCDQGLEQIHPIDKLLLEFIDNAPLKLKMEAMLCRIKVEFEARRLLKILAKVVKCSEVLVESLAQGGLLSRLLDATLRIGNQLNGTSVDGFKIKSLEKLKDCRSHSSRGVTLMNVLAESVLSSGVDSRQFIKDCLSLAFIAKEVSDIDLNQTAADLGAVVSALDKAEKTILLYEHENTKEAASTDCGENCDLLRPNTTRTLQPSFAFLLTPKSLSSCSSTKDSSSPTLGSMVNLGSLDTDPMSPISAETLCTEENVIRHLSLFVKWAENIISVLQRHFFSSKDRLMSICKLLGESDDKAINIVTGVLAAFLRSLVQVCRVQVQQNANNAALPSNVSLPQSQSEGTLRTSTSPRLPRPQLQLPTLHPSSGCEVLNIDFDRASFDEVLDFLNIPLATNTSGTCPFLLTHKVTR